MAPARSSTPQGGDGGYARSRALWVALSLAAACTAIGCFLLAMRGLESRWPGWHFAALLIAALASGFAVLFGLDEAFGIGSWTRVAGHSFGGFLAILFFLLVGVVGLCLLGIRVPGVGYGRTAFSAIAALSIGAGWARPWWIWQSPQVRSWRALLGDRAVRLIYLLLGVGFLLLVAFDAPWQDPS